MIPTPLMSALLDSALAKLAARLMPREDFINPSIATKVAMLNAALLKASAGKRMSSAEDLIQILKSLDTKDAISLLSTIVKTDTDLMTKVASDPIIQQRIMHIYRVAEIAAIVSKNNLRSVSNGISGVRRKIFEVSSK